MNGILVVYKESGPTSFDIVHEVSKILKTKVGHTGTLDPLAEGILILTIGKYTKLSSDIMSHEKEYIATVRVGVSTDTLDITGKILKEKDEIVPSNIDEVLNSFKKTYLQEVPKYSAVKVNGKKLYEYARNNIEVELPKKEVTIKEIELLSKTVKEFTFRCLVSKGCYIRSLIRDIGESINIPMTMEKLIRTKEYNYGVNDSYRISDIKNNNYKLLSLEEVFNYPIINIDINLKKKVLNGCILDNTFNVKDKVIFKYNNEVVAIYKKENNKLRMYFLNN